MAESSDTRPEGQYPTADLSKKAVAAHAEKLGWLRPSIEPAATCASRMAADAIDLAKLQRELHTWIAATVRASRYENGGDLICAVSKKLGLDVVDNVLALVPAARAPRANPSDYRRLQRYAQAHRQTLAPAKASIDARLDRIEEQADRLCDKLLELARRLRNASAPDDGAEPPAARGRPSGSYGRAQLPGQDTRSELLEAGGVDAV